MTRSSSSSKAGTPVLRDQLAAVATELDRVTQHPDHLADDDARALQGILGAAVRAFAARRRYGDEFDPFDANGDTGPPTSTDVAITVTAMLQSAGIEIFELGLWQSWGSTSAGNATDRSEP